MQKKIERLKILIIKYQKYGSVFIFLTVSIILFWIFSSSSKVELDKVDIIANKIAKPEMKSTLDSVDPRAVWVDRISKELESNTAKLEEILKQQNEVHQEAINSLQKEIEDIKVQNLQNTNSNNFNIQNENNNEHNISEKEEEKLESNLAHLHLEGDKFLVKNIDEYVTSGSFARAVLLTGVVAETGTDAASSPQPILLRLVDFGIFSKNYITKQIKEAILIGSCHGNISSERAICRLETISLMNFENKIIEKPIEGWIIGEDGRPGIKGDVVDKSSSVARLAVLNGILGGMASFFQNQAQSSVFPVSPIMGQTNSLTGIDALKAGGASGAQNALQKLADYAIKRAEQMSPVIIIGAGRTVDVVFKKGFELKDDNSIAGNINNNNQVISISGKENTYKENQPLIHNAIKQELKNQGFENQGLNKIKNSQINKGEF